MTVEHEGIRVTAMPLTPWSLALNAARLTVRRPPAEQGREPSDAFKDAILDAEHSPCRCLLWSIVMEGIPSFVSVHLVRHKIGVEHYVSSNRPDRNGGNTDVTRLTPVDHMMVANAQALMTMARRRLCGCASPETRKVMEMICEAVAAHDPALARHLVPMCVYRGGVCHELGGCGLCPKE